MWVDNNISYPLEDGVYMTLVDIDDFNTLAEYPGTFEGGEWSHYESFRQFIRYWWANDEQYEKVVKTFRDE